MAKQRRSIVQQHYIHRMRYSTQERMVGVFVLTAILILILLLFVSGDTLRLFESRVTYTAYMRNAVGVSTNTKVRISGIEVGSVQGISLNTDNRFKVVISIYEEFQGLVRTDSRASVSRLAIIGDSVIKITPGSTKQPMLPEGGILRVDETLGIDQIIANLRPTLEKINRSIDKVASVVSNIPSDSLSTLLNNTAEASVHINQIGKQIASGDGVLGSLVYEQQLQQKIDTSLQELINTLTGIQKTVSQTQVAAATLPQAIADFSQTLSIVRAEAEALPELSNDTRQLLEDIQKVVDALSNTWPISSNVPTGLNAPVELPLQHSHD